MSPPSRVPAHPSPTSSTPRGMLLVGLAALGFTCMHGVIRHLSGELHPFEIAFFRNLFGLLVLSPFFLHYGRRVLHTRRFAAHLLRGVLQVGAMLLFFTALTLAPLSEVSALSFTSPLFATVGAVLLLGERIRARRIVAVVVGFGGALVILQPGAVPIGAGSLMVLGSSAVWALTMLLIKHLTSSESSLTLTAYMGLVMSPLSLLPALLVWRWPDPASYLWLALMGTLGAASQYAMAEAFRGADASAVLPVDFSRLIWASVIGYTFFGEVPAAATWIGGAIIFASTTYIALREARLERTAAGPPRGVGPEETVLPPPP